MMIEVKVNVTRGASTALQTMVSMMTGKDLADLNAVGGRSSMNAAIKFHRNFDQSGAWRGKRYLGPGPDGSVFGAEVARGWNFQGSDETGAVIGNNAEHFAFKIRGGTIIPKRAGALTIPLVPDAKGRRAADYEIFFRRKLFRIKGKDCLFERVERTLTGARGRRGQPGTTQIRKNGIRAVYALKKSVTIRPFPEAMPSNDLLSEAFVESWTSALLRKIEQS